MSGAPRLDRSTVLEAFTRLAERLSRKDIVATVYLFGGGAMLMAFDGRAATSDLDARFTSTAGIIHDVHAVADEMGLPRWWLNEQGTSYLPRHDDPHSVPVFDHPNLRVGRVSDRHLLAMKVAASRRNTSDIADIALLARRLGLKSAPEIIRLYGEVFPDEPLSERKRVIIAEAIREDTDTTSERPR